MWIAQCIFYRTSRLKSGGNVAAKKNLAKVSDLIQPPKLTNNDSIIYVPVISTTSTQHEVTSSVTTQKSGFVRIDSPGLFLYKKVVITSPKAGGKENKPLHRPKRRKAQPAVTLSYKSGRSLTEKDSIFSADFTSSSPTVDLTHHISPTAPIKPVNNSDEISLSCSSNINLAGDIVDQSRDVIRCANQPQGGVLAIKQSQNGIYPIDQLQSSCSVISIDQSQSCFDSNSTKQNVCLDLNELLKLGLITRGENLLSFYNAVSCYAEKNLALQVWLLLKSRAASGSMDQVVSVNSTTKKRLDVISPLQD